MAGGLGVAYRTYELGQVVGRLLIGIDNSAWNGVAAVEVVDDVDYVQQRIGTVVDVVLKSH
jgi:hypothetical protein